VAYLQVLEDKYALPLLSCREKVSANGADSKFSVHSHTDRATRAPTLYALERLKIKVGRLHERHVEICGHTY
jgi:hypothetical protein